MPAQQQAVDVVCNQLLHQNYHRKHNLMRKLKTKSIKLTILYFLTILSSTYIYSQSINLFTCDSLLNEGYTKSFCEYNVKYSFKNIPFECNQHFLSSKIQLTKSPSRPNTFISTDIDVREWEGLIFDYSIFKFSATDKLEEVILKLKKDDNDTAKLRSDFLNTLDTLEKRFGKGKGLPSDLFLKNNIQWWGNKVNVLIGMPDKNSLELMIQRTNINDLDNM
jgi:hypothetical protein